MVLSPFSGGEAFKGAGAPSLKTEVSVSSNSNRVILDSQELNAASGVSPFFPVFSLARGISGERH